MALARQVVKPCSLQWGCRHSFSQGKFACSGSKTGLSFALEQARDGRGGYLAGLQVLKPNGR